MGAPLASVQQSGDLANLNYKIILKEVLIAAPAAGVQIP
jgi:hypothetical protein